MGTDGEVANALVCKTSIHGFKSHSVLQNLCNLEAARFWAALLMQGKVWGVRAMAGFVGLKRAREGY